MNFPLYCSTISNKIKLKLQFNQHENVITTLSKIKAIVKLNVRNHCALKLGGTKPRILMCCYILM